LAALALTVKVMGEPARGASGEIETRIVTPLDVPDQTC
jgi:hypothetical protein